MRINVYTEELLLDGDKPIVEIAKAKYISSRTGENMVNYGVRIFLKSAPELHYIPDRDDDRSAITFWCGPTERNAIEFLDMILNKAREKTWASKTLTVQAEAEAAIKK